MFKPSRPEILALIEAAVAAPSADNCHRLRFEIHETGLVLRTDDFYAACDQAHRRRLCELSYGAVAENMRLWLSARGRAFRPAWFPDADDPRVLLRCAWADLVEHRASEPLEPHIATRHTNRKFFRGPALSASERASIDAAFADFPGIRLDWFDEPSRRSALLGLMRRAETERFRHRHHHAELFESIAFEAGWSSPTVERLAPGALEVDPPFHHVFAALGRWSVMRTLNRVGAATLLGLRAAYLPARLSPHVLVIASRSPSRAAALEGGAAFQRAWLAAEALGLALQPMAAAAVLAHDPVMDATLGLTDRWRGLLGADWSPVMVFRLGRSAPPRIRSLRRPAIDYVTAAVDRAALDRMPAST